MTEATQDAGGSTSRPPNPSVHVLGIRHHGPGSAKSVERALAQLQPDCVLIEGPPELTSVIGLAARAEMVPPIAGFVYATDRPELASFDPFAVFSPEWVALRHGLAAGATVRFIDLPVTHDLAIRAAALTQAPEPATQAVPASSESKGDLGTPETAELDTIEPDHAGDVESETARLSLGYRARLDPIGLLAELAGAGDAEQWWEDVVEHRSVQHQSGGANDASGTSSSSLVSFAAVLEAMTELRAVAEAELDQQPDRATSYSVAPPGHSERDRKRELQREASMRQFIRQAEKDGFTNIAVICGAWHAPVLRRDRFPSAASDAALLKGLPKISITATWTPWTHQLLARASGYGAGVTAPGWYHHVFTHSDDGTRRLVTSWLVSAARALRLEALDASPASVIEAVRLAETLAALRARPLAGLDEVNDATRTVLCGGSPDRFGLIVRKLLTDQRLGEVPADTPQVPLAKDFAMSVKQLRLKQTAVAETLELDLRTPSGLGRSHFFHRLAVIGVDWARPTGTLTRTTGTFKEAWATEWKPELAIAFVEASRFGTTVLGAAVGAATEQAATAELPQLTRLLGQVLQGAVTQAVDPVLRALSERAAESHDISVLLSTIPALARIARYGDVRKTDTDAVGVVLEGLVTRVCAGLAGAASQLDDDAASAFRASLEEVHSALGTVDDTDLRRQWNEALQRIHRASRLHQDAVHGEVAGRACRLLRDGGYLDQDAVANSLSGVLSVGSDAGVGAHWIEGFFAGGGLVLLHDADLLNMVDDWMATVMGHTFDDVLPLLRRTFGGFPAAERRMIGAAIKDARGTAQQTVGPTDLTAALQAVTPTILLLLGLDRGTNVMDPKGQAVAGVSL
jgi:hypothetical protein